MTGIRIAPRAERAREIPWSEWGREPFERAKRENKPVLLGISGVWCHWCHVMDETTYSEPKVIELIKDKFIPVRVDTDMRPDVNARYNMGGWPSTVVLSASGDIITGATYIPPDRMIPWLDRALRTAAAIGVRKSPEPTLEEDEVVADFEPSWDPYMDILMNVVVSFDRHYGGFGDAPKFPMADAIGLTIHAYDLYREDLYRTAFEKTLKAMAGGGTYDPVEGGFFRYSTTRDWSIPHFEKMLQDNSVLLRCMGDAYRVTGDEAYKDLAQDIVRFLDTVMYMEDLRAYAGTQDADEEYYRLPLEMRRKREPPFIDKTLYTDWNGMAASALIQAGRAVGKDEWVSRGIEVLGSVIEKCYDPGHGLAHYFTDGPHHFGLSHDLVSLGSACLHAHSATEDTKWLDRSRSFADTLISDYAAPGGGFYDRLGDPEVPFGPKDRLRDFQENAYAAIWLARLSRQEGDPRYHRAAFSALSYCDRNYPEYGILAAPYALGLAIYLRTLDTGPEVICEDGVCRPVERGKDHSIQPGLPQA